MSLSDFSYYVRKFGPIALVGFLFFIIFFAVIRALLGAANTPEPIEVVYQPPHGILPPIEFSHSIDYPPNFTMTIDNIEGRPLTPAEEANVYTIPQTRTRFGYQQTIAFMAKAVGINTEEEQYSIEDITATYRDPLRKLEVDITNFNFAFELDFQKIPTIFNDTFMPNELSIIEEAKTFLRQMNAFTPTLAQGKQNVIYLRYDGATDDFIVVDTPQQANVVEVDFFTPDIDTYPGVSPKYFNSHTFVTMVFRQEGNVIIKSHVSNFDHDTSSAGAYPLKDGGLAWQELQNQQGTIVSPSQGTTDIVIREMFLGYYQSEEYTQFLMPVYVFLGDNGFAAYVSAVDSQYTQGTAPLPEENTPQ